MSSLDHLTNDQIQFADRATNEQLKDAHRAVFEDENLTSMTELFFVDSNFSVDLLKNGFPRE